MNGERPDDLQHERNLAARRQALAALVGVSPRPGAQLRYVSRGRLVIIGGSRAAELAPGLAGRLKPTVVLTEGAEEPGMPQVPLGGRSLQIEGHLGNFTLRLGEKGTPGYQRLEADLVLDLQPEPLLRMAAPPPGYLASADDDLSVAAAREELEQLVGTFEKPLFLQLDAGRCAHARSSIQACSRCLEACPAQAIQSAGETVAVDQDRCQGCGICTMVCPSGAMQYQVLRVEEALEQIRRLLKVYREAGGQSPVLVLHDETRRQEAESMPPDHLPWEVGSPLSLGLEFWLGALAYGASQVRLLVEEELPAGVEAALALQLEIAGEILSAMGYPREAVTRLPSDARMPVIEAARFAPCGDKRQLFYLALDHLQSQARRTRPLVQLPAGAPFGMASVDAGRCTLCKACVGACPGRALQDVTEEPAIGFLEANCLQCGTCTRTCPEQAITITPRLLLDPEQRNRRRILHREEPFECISCGKPFATRAVVLRMQQALQGHWMYQDEAARRRLQMCDQCRVVDLARDPDAMARASGLHPGH